MTAGSDLAVTLVAAAHDAEHEDMAASWAVPVAYATRGGTQALGVPGRISKQIYEVT